MSHPQQIEFCKKIRKLFPSFFQYQFVLDIGSLNTNGDNRYLFDNCYYLGVDIADGKNVVNPGGKVHLPDNSVDTIISTECLEYDMFYSETLLNMYRILKPGGLLIFTCATDGPREQGREKTNPQNASLPQKNFKWKNYYKNLNEKHIRELFEIETLFKVVTFEENKEANAFYFYGFKMGEHIQRENPYSSQNKIEELRVVISEKDSVISEKDSVISEKDSVISEMDSVISEMDSVLNEINTIIQLRIDAKNVGLLSRVLFKIRRKKLKRNAIKICRESDFFNAEWYLSKYSDVKDANVDPVSHYVQNGAKEGRDPGPMFSTTKYVIAHPEILKNGINPLVHFQSSVHREGKKNLIWHVTKKIELLNNLISNLASIKLSALSKISLNKANKSDYNSTDSALTLPIINCRPEVSISKMKVANGQWEWEDYTLIKSRINTIKLLKNTKFVPKAVPLIKLDKLDYNSIISTLNLPTINCRPEVSIIIPVHNNLLLTLECIASIITYTKNNPSYEIIIADDASTDETQKIIPLIANIKYLRNDANLGFLKNCNRALKLITSDYVIFLNNDTQVTNDWLPALRNTFDDYANIGAVGPQFLYPNGYLQEVGGTLHLDGTAQMIGLNEDPSQPRYSYPRKVDYVSGACLMMPTKLAKKLNGFSEDYLPCYCEDSDLCLRIKKLGYEIYVNPKATVIHHLSQTMSGDEDLKTSNIAKNLPIFKKKWLPYIESKRTKIIAFYLPQYHPFPENDKWWGEGFTEWTNVTKAQPNFVGHYQPRLPADLGFYDLRILETMQKQAELAMRYGVYGFCYYYYWFGGKRLLDLPIEQMLANKKPEFPFCLCWANENWTRRWDGADHEVLMSQSHSSSDDINVINDLIRYFKDERYIRIDGRPLILIYRVGLFPEFKKTAELWRKVCQEQGVGKIYIALVESCDFIHQGITPGEYGCDAAVEFPPHGSPERKNPNGASLNPNFKGDAADYRDVAVRYATQNQPGYKRFMSVMPGWDNTARRQDNSFILEHATPGAFQAWLEEAMIQTWVQHHGDERLVFINGWNEWAEGAYLEPDQVFGHTFLEAVKNASESAELLF